MSYQLVFDTKTTGAESLAQVDAIIAKLSASTKASAGDLKILDTVLRGDAAAGIALEASLKALASSAATAGPGVAALAKEAQAFSVVATVARTSTDQFTAATTRLGAAHATAVPQIAAASSAIRVLEGAMPIRAVERFAVNVLGLGPLLSAAFPIVGAIAFGEMVFSIGEKVGKMTGLWGGVTEAEKKATEEAGRLDDKIRQIGESIARINQQQINLRLGPVAGKALESAGTAQTAQQAENAVAMAYTALAKPLMALDPRFSKMAMSGRQGMQVPLEGSDAIQKALEEADAVDAAGKTTGADTITAYRRKLRALDPFRRKLQAAQTERERLTQQSALESGQTLQASGDEAQAQRNTQTERDNAARTAAHAATEALRKSDDEGLAHLQATHELSIGEVIKYWQKRLAVESANAERAREITDKLGPLYQQSGRTVERVAAHGAEEEKKAQEQRDREKKHWENYFDELDRMADENARKEAERAVREADRATEIKIASARNVREITDAGTKADTEDRKAGLGRESKLISASTLPGASNELNALRQQVELRRQAAQIDRDEKQRDIDAQRQQQAQLLHDAPEKQKEIAGELAHLRVEEIQNQRNYERELGDERIDIEIKVAEIRKQQLERSRELIGGLFDAATSRQPNAIPNFLKSQVLNVGKQITENALGGAVNAIIPKSASPLLQGTIFGGVNAKDAAVALNTTSTAENTRSIDKNTGAVADLYAAFTGKADPNAPAGSGASASSAAPGSLVASLASVGSLATSATGGGGGLVAGGIGGLAALAGLAKIFSGGSASGVQSAAQIAGAPAGNWDVYSQAGVNPNYQGTQLVSNPGNVMTGPSGGVRGPLAGSVEGALFDPSQLTGARVGSGIATAGVVVGGTMAAIQGFKKGGAQGGLQGVSAIAGTVAALDPEPISKAVLAGVAVVTGMVAAILGDPHVLRENAINKAIATQTYNAPQALNVTQSASGTFADFDARGNLRGSTFSAVPTVRQQTTWEQTHGLFGGPPTFYTVPGEQTSQFGPNVGGAPAPVVINHNYGPNSISTIDAASFAGLLSRSHAAVGDAAATALQNAHGRLSSEVQRTAGV